MIFSSMLRKLTWRHPPSLHHVLQQFYDVESLMEFILLIQNYLPDQECAIMKQKGSTDRCIAFVRVFSERYFHIDEFIDYDEYEFLTREIPITLLGINFEDFEDLDNWEPEQICLFALIPYPFWSNDETGIHDRVPILAAAEKYVDVSLVPPAGFSLENLHQSLDGTQYQGLVYFAEWAHADTGVWELDANYTDNQELPDWTDENVAELVRQQPEAQKYWNGIHTIEAWLKKDLKSNFAELLGAIKPYVPKEQMSLFEIFKGDKK